MGAKAVQAANAIYVSKIYKCTPVYIISTEAKFPIHNCKIYNLQDGAKIFGCKSAPVNPSELGPQSVGAYFREGRTTGMEKGSGDRGNREQRRARHREEQRKVEEESIEYI